MCTVTYIPLNKENQFVLTSNRDERINRPTIKPERYRINDISVCFPKDEQAGGTWIGMNEKGRIAVLLNGAFKSHDKMPHHTYSRGKVLLNLLTTTNYSLNFFDEQNLENTEPFTIITIDTKEDELVDFNEFIWDGSDKHFRDLAFNREYIWSSSTLYSENKRKQRRLWFDKFIKQHSGSINPEKIFKFHTGNHTHNKSNNLVMERDNELKTVSITQVTNKQKGLLMNYTDLTNNTFHKQWL